MKKLKFPDRTCKECNKYPCFLGFENSTCDFAKYGCKSYANHKSKMSSC